jgi:hypothetical protein
VADRFIDITVPTNHDKISDLSDLSDQSIGALFCTAI